MITNFLILFKKSPLLAQNEVRANYFPFVQNLKSRKAESEQKIDRLLDIYIEGGLAREEYQAKKAKLLNEKAAGEHKRNRTLIKGET